MRFLSSWVDERFLTHRLKSTSSAGITVAVASILTFGYRFYIQHVWDWEMAAVGVGFVVVKMSLMAYYVLTD